MRRRRISKLGTNCNYRVAEVPGALECKAKACLVMANCTEGFEILEDPSTADKISSQACRIRIYCATFIHDDDLLYRSHYY